MLTKESSRGFNEMSSYPTYEYYSKRGNRHTAKCDGSRIIPTPKGYTERIEYATVEDHFADYLKWLEDDHKDIPDEKMKAHPYGIFIGNWRNARWFDEAQRRGLIKVI